MSIFNSLFIGTSGINAHGKAIGIVGDNVANVSTTGFKASKAQFADVLGGQFGAGVRLGGAGGEFSQGVLQQTGGAFDFAVRGSGFFAVKGNHAGREGTFFTRNGSFALDNEGFVVTPGGLRLQGFAIDTAGNQSTQLGDLQIGQGQTPPQPTTAVDMELNVDASSTTPPPFDLLDAGGTSNFATSVTVFDSLGEEHRVEVFFRNQGGGSWEWHATVDGSEVVGGAPGTLSEVASGTLTFTSNGQLDTETVISSNANFVGAEPNQSIAFDFGDAITTDGGTGLDGTTQFAGPSTVSSVNQDGFSFGTLINIDVADDGTIVGAFSNGQNREIARLALAEFQSEQGLARAGDQIFAETLDSGQALIAAAATGSRGAISAGALESSNVDLGGEMVTLIAFQRAFQANARTVTASDELLTEVANLKR